MTDKPLSSLSGQDTKSSLFNLLGLACVLLFFVISGWVSYSNMLAIRSAANETTRTHDTLSALHNILLYMQDAETGQRGYVLTGDPAYLDPYKTAPSRVHESVEKLQYLMTDMPSYLITLKSLSSNIDSKFEEMEKTIELRSTAGFDAALKLVKTDAGKEAMDSIRRYVSGLVSSESAIRAERLKSIEDAYKKAIISGILSSIFGIILAASASLAIHRALILRQRREWLKQGQSLLAAKMLGDKTPAVLGQAVLEFFADYLGTVAGAFYIRKGNSFDLSATYGVPSGASIQPQFDFSDGILGQAARDKKIFTLKNVPDGYLFYGSALGQTSPKTLVVVPSTDNQYVNTVIELGFTQDEDERGLELLRSVTDSIAIAVRSAEYRQHLQSLLEETQRQSEELQAQSEELRVSNEELEEQGRTLRESQTRLEQQQAELEQTNSQLEEQAQQLETQRNDLARSKNQIEQKAEEIERTSKYKSDFLANMSHELRTPLNSCLILSKLLADNPMGNLSADQVKYAETIQSAGNDLLTLINDILDLSKIEAGHMEVDAGPVHLSRLADDMARMFEPVAGKKSLSFEIIISDTAPQTITTDRQRLEQVLKNLLSNAFKFTEQGGVTLSMAEREGKISFSVSDTGIGMTPEQQTSVFEAFRQADGTISRKYGGTGLGLSISRELAKLLEGEITLTSERNKGSTFSLILPLHYEGKDNSGSFDNRHVPVIERSIRRDTNSTKILPAPLDAETAGLENSSTGRSILIVEDDRSFARILIDLAREMGFRAFLSETAEDALSLAREHLPAAIVLDIGLPDSNGLSVLDRLKQDARTRHIPVHVVSANDYTRTVLSMGAIGHAIKPVKREDLADVFRRLELKLNTGRKKVLVVEDDPVQRESIGHLLGSKDVDIVGVGTAAECLDLLKTTTFDCMVLDLSLPDSNGFSLLETLGAQDAYSFPPVIIYTGKDMTLAEERDLRRYSKSIIIKGAKSPERLLDEVTLFLHQVVSDLPPEKQNMIRKSLNRDEALERKRILIVEDDARNVYSLTNILEPFGTIVSVAGNGREALDMLEKTQGTDQAIDLVLMDVMMPEMDGLTATREIRKRREWRKLPIIMLTAKAMRDDQEHCLAAGANDYMSKPLDVEKLLSLVRVWMPR